MPRKPKAERKQIHVELDGGIVDVKMFPPEPVRNRKAWYAYWKGLKARKTTGETDYDKAVQAVAVMLHNGGEKPCCDEDHLLTDEEFIEIQRRHFSKKTDPASKKRAESSLTNALEAIDSFRRVSGLNPISRATPDDCERFQTEALQLPRNWRSRRAAETVAVFPEKVARCHRRRGDDEDLRLVMGQTGRSRGAEMGRPPNRWR